jgi:hypothetical protein
VPTRKPKVLMLALVVAMPALITHCQERKPGETRNSGSHTKLAPATPIDAEKAELGGKTWNPEWDAFIEKKIPPQMLGPQVPHDVKRFCPNFYSMSETDKRTFWAYFFQALAAAEAGINPHVIARHANLDPPERAASSRYTEGLLQLSYADHKRYGCDFDWRADRELPPGERSILQPKKNLVCGINILENQIIQKHEPLLTRSSYWSTLRPGTLSYRVFAKQMTNPPAACGKHVKSTLTPATTTAIVKATAKQSKDPE